MLTFHGEQVRPFISSEGKISPTVSKGYEKTANATRDSRVFKIPTTLPKFNMEPKNDGFHVRFISFSNGWENQVNLFLTLGG